MSSLLTALQTAGTALRGFEKAIGVVQTNVLNASTAGYARQQLQMTADAFDTDGGHYGGLETGNVETSRSTYSEQSVQQQSQVSGYYNELVTVLSPLQSVFDLTGTTGMTARLSAMFDAFSAWSQAPNDTNARQNVVATATAMTVGFHLAYEQLAADGDSIRGQVGATVSKINALAKDIAAANQSIITSKSTNGSVDDSSLYTDLEELSGLANVSYVQASDGTYTVLLAGQTPLVVGETTYDLTTSSIPNSGGIPAVAVSSGGIDITASLTGGSLGAELSAYNGTLTSLLGGASSTLPSATVVAGSLNSLAATLAAKVNAILVLGQTTAGVAGLPMFQVPAGTAAASGIGLAAGFTEADLGAIETSTSIGNGTPLALAGLSSSLQTIGTANGVSFTDYLAGVAADVGRQISTAESSSTRQSQLLSQAKSLRSGVSGVSLDEEAAQLMAFQQSYSATAQVFTVVNRMLDTLIGLVH